MEKNANNRLTDYTFSIGIGQLGIELKILFFEYPFSAGVALGID
jgi:hypothetical protein